MKEIKPDYYSSMPEMLAELNAKITKEHKTINLHSDSFDIRFLWFLLQDVKSRYGDMNCVIYEQLQFLPLRRSNSQTVEINIKSNAGQLVSFESGKSIVTLVFRTKSLFHRFIDYQQLKEQHVKDVMVLAVSSKGWQERLHLLWKRVFWIWGSKPSRVEFRYWMNLVEENIWRWLSRDVQ